MQKDIAAIRKNYSRKSLSESDLEKDPIRQFEKWWNEALDSGIDEVNAMTLATATKDGMPSARIVLLKGFSNKGFIYFTHYNSHKGRQLEENPRACLVFFWKELERQVRITGTVEKTGDDENDAYFYSRPPESQAGACASPQSEVIENREWLEMEFEKIRSQAEKIHRPIHWGGYLVKPRIIEFWQGRPSRLHDRLEYSLMEHGEWKIQRLAP